MRRRRSPVCWPGPGSRGSTPSAFTCGPACRTPRPSPTATAGKLADLSMALVGRFIEHHALLCRLHLDRIAVFGDAVDGLDGRIAGKAARWQHETGLLTSVPGFGDVVAQAWLGEIGPAPHRHFASHQKLAC